MPLKVITIEVGPEDDFALPDGWRLVVEESVEEPEGLVALKFLKLLARGESCVSGEEMLRRAKHLGRRAGLRCLRASLRMQEQFPDFRRGGEVPVFLGTVALNDQGQRVVPYAKSSGGDRYLGWVLLTGGLGPASRLVRFSPARS